MLTTRDECIEKTREAACDSLGVARDSLINGDQKHTHTERELLISLAARLVLQAVDNDFAELNPALESIKQVLESDYPHLIGPE